MAAKKRLRAAAGVAESQVKAGAQKVQEQLHTVEKAAGMLATKAKQRLPAPADVKAEVPAVLERLQRATAVVTRRKDGAGTPAAASAGAATPDDSWTVADLRAEARRRGMTGYSRKVKADLLAALRG
jgi:hypothetical protein